MQVVVREVGDRFRERRKEVALGSLRTLTVLLTLGAWGVATEGAPPDGLAPPGAPTARPDPPAPPRDYVKAASWLVESGDTARAAAYIKAADDYRDLLTADEQTTLDALKARLGITKVSALGSTGAVPPAAFATPAPVPVAAVPSPSAPPPVAPPGQTAYRGAPDDKQAATWLLKQAREHIARGEGDEARRKVEQAKAMNVRWTLFDDTPARVEKDLAALPSTTPVGATHGDRREAKARLKEAREALAAGQIQKAEAIANEVDSWHVDFGILDDTPEKVMSAARAVRRRDIARNAGGAAGASQDLYGVLVAEARAALTAGHLEEAEYKASRAQMMNVAPPLTADRAEAVLHDLAMVRAQGAAPAVVAESPAAQAEREANELLAAGDREAAAVKFLEAERHRVGMAAIADPSVQRVQAPGDAPALGNPGPVLELESAPAPAEAAAPSLVSEPAAPVLIDPAAPGTDAATTVNAGEAMLQQATALMVAGNLQDARRLAEQARGGGYGVEAKADALLAQLSLTSQGGALQLYEAALDALRKQDVDRARALLNEVVNMEVQDQGLLQRVQDLMTRLPAEPAGVANLGAINDVEAVKAQKLNVEVGTKIAESRRLLEIDPERAIELLDQTLAGVKAAEINETARKTLTRRLEVTIELARKDKASFDEKMKDKRYRAEIESKRLRILEADKAKKAQVEMLMTKAKEAEARNDLAEAEQLARKAAEIDPSEVAAVAMATVMRTKRHYETDRRIIADKAEGALTAMQEADAASIMDPIVQQRGIRMPETFAELTASRRELASRLERKKDPGVLAIEEKLNEPITLSMQQPQSLGEVISYLKSYTGMNIVLDGKALNEEGLTRDTPVELNVKDIKLKTALKLILSPLNLTYKVEEGVLQITSPQASRNDQIVRAYNVADLIISPHRKKSMNKGPNGMFSPTDVNAAAGPGLNANDPNAPAAAVPGLPGAIPSMGGTGGAQVSYGDAQVTDADFEPLIQLIKASIAPNTWRDGPDGSAGLGGYGLGALGGGEGELGVVGGYNSITPFYLNISLIVRATSEIHDEIVDLLRQLRRLQDLQISVEVRFITVSDSFFEEIGVDFDFAIQSDVVGRKSSFAIPNPAAVPAAVTGGTGGTAGTGGGVSPYLINPIRDHAYGNRQPLVVGTNAPTSSIVDPSFSSNLEIPFVQDGISAITPFNALTGNTGATFGLAFLSDLEVFFFIRAVQGDTRNNLVQAPKVTTFNGAPAAVFNQTQRWFVQSLQPIVGAGAVAFQPSIGSIPDGVSLFVTPVVSADRRYVRMTLAPFFINLIEFQTFTVPAAVGGGGLGGQATGINGQIQLPVFSFTNVDTTVTVPDGGTVLLGGVKRMREQRTEVGVPILAKTPLIDRLFRNIGIGRTTDSLMIMVTPRIIILEEEEERLGIPAVNVAF